MTCASVYTHFRDWEPDVVDTWLGDEGHERCVGPQGHAEPHENADGDEWTDEDNSFRYKVAPSE